MEQTIGINSFSENEASNLMLGQKGFDIIPKSGIMYCGGVITSVDGSKVFTFADDADDDTANVANGLADGDQIWITGTGTYDGLHTITDVTGTAITIGGLSSTTAETFSGTRWSRKLHDRWVAITPIGTTIATAYLLRARSLVGDDLTLTGVYATGGNVALVHGVVQVGVFDAITNGESTAGKVLCAIRG